MHIPDGLLPAPICLGGYALTGLITWYSLRQIHRQERRSPGNAADATEEIPKASLLTAAFFVASSIHLPIPPTSVHLVLNGLLGAVLGYFAFPAILIGLFFQALVFGHGGLTTLGVNAVMMGVPALLAAQIFRLRQVLRPWFNPKLALGISGFLAGAIGVALAALIFFTLVITFIPAGFDPTTERLAIYGLMLAHIPLMGLEGIFTAALVLFLQQVKPEMLKNSG